MHQYNTLKLILPIVYACHMHFFNYQFVNTQKSLVVNLCFEPRALKDSYVVEIKFRFEKVYSYENIQATGNGSYS